MDIKHRVTGEVLHTVEGDTLCGANLRGADPEVQHLQAGLSMVAAESHRAADLGLEEVTNDG